MLYPKKINAKKGKIITRGMMLISFLVSILLMIINYYTTSHIYWSLLCVAGIIYIWITALYALNKNINIAAHVLIQAIAVSILMLVIDGLFGFRKWSLHLGIPIVIIVSNAAMLVLTIISHRKYIRYAIYQLTLCMLSMGLYFLLSAHRIQDRMLGYVAMGVSIFNVVITLVLCSNEMKEELQRKFHL